MNLVKSLVSFNIIILCEKKKLFIVYLFVLLLVFFILLFSLLNLNTHDSMIVKNQYVKTFSLDISKNS